MGKRMMVMEVLGKRRSERPKRRLLDNIRNDLLERDLSGEEAQYWKKKNVSWRWVTLTRDLEKYCQKGK